MNNQRKVNFAEVLVKRYVRRYDNSYFTLGFTAGENEKNLPNCVICLNMFSNQSMKPSHLKRHQTKHLELEDKSTDFSKQKLAETEVSKK
jgi:hypothetical protein